MKKFLYTDSMQTDWQGFKVKITADLLIWIFIISIATYLRYMNLSTIPGWYSDEGTVVEIAKNLLDGRIQYLVINKSTLLAARLPLFPLLLAGIFTFAEIGITTLRYFSAGLGVLSVGLLYWVILDIGGKQRRYLALTAAFFLAIYPPAILYSRLGFSYNLLTPLVVMMIWFLWKYLDTGQKRWIYQAGLMVGIGSISDLMMLTLMPVIMVVAFVKNWKNLFIAFGLMILPFSLYSVSMMVLNKGAFLFDFEFIFFRLGEVPLIAQYPSIVFHYAFLLMKDYWWSLAVIGMFIHPEKKLKYVSLILCFMPLFLLARTAVLTGIGLYYVSPLFPLIAFGVGSLVVIGIPKALLVIRIGLERLIKPIKEIDKKNRFGNIWKPGIFVVSSLILFLIVVSPIIITLFQGVHQAQTGIKSEIDQVMVNVDDAKNVIIFVNGRSKDDDLVLASPALAWAIESNAADFQMAVAYTGGETKHFPTNIPSNRFIFNTDFNQADYVILDPIWWNWAVPNMPEVEDMVQVVASWSKVYSAGQVEVYENPQRDIK